MRFSAILFHCKVQKRHEQYYQTDISNTSSSQDMAFCIMTSHPTQSLRPLNHCYKQFCFTARCVQPAYARTFRAMVTFVVGMLGFCVWEPRETTTPICGGQNHSVDSVPSERSQCQAFCAGCVLKRCHVLCELNMSDVCRTRVASKVTLPLAQLPSPQIQDACHWQPQCQPLLVVMCSCL